MGMAQELPDVGGGKLRVRGAVVLDQPLDAPQDLAAPAKPLPPAAEERAAAEPLVGEVVAGQDDEGVLKTQADAGDEKRFPHGATLQTNPDIEEVLRKAQRYMEEGNYRAASRFWQAAVQRAGDQLYSSDGEMYYPLVRKIEEIIAQLPPEGLSTYRIAADAEATEYLADDGQSDPATRWQKVVNLAFLSSQGDQAALQLASYYLDRYQAIPAELLLRRILEVYPDSKVPRDEVWLKLAIAYALSGDRQRGQAALAQARELRQTVTPAVLDQVAVMLQTAESFNPPSVAGNLSRQWTSSLGLGSQIQTMPDLPPGFLDQSLAPVWMFQHDFLKQPRGKFIEGEVYLNLEQILGATFPSSTQDREFEAVCRDWQKNGWRSASMPLLVDNKIIFKTQADLAVWPTDQLRHEPLLRSLNLNRYAPDEITKFILEQSDQNRRNFPAAADLSYSSIETLQYFGDPAFQAMTVHNGVVYSIEGDSFGRDAVYRDPGRRNPVNAWSSPPTRDRRTFLAAYEISSGRTLWTNSFPRNEPGTDLEGAAIVGPPVGYQSQVLVPVLAAGRFLLVSVDGLTGRSVWTRVICDLPQLQPPATTLVQLAVQGSDVFMVCGCGVMANVDAGSGQLRWVRRYPRSVEEMDAEGGNQQFFGRVNQDWQRYRLQGWSHDLATVWGNWVVVAATDTNYLAGYRRTDGALVWQAPRADVLGCTVDQWLGVADGIAYATGPRGLIAYELAAEGRLYGTPQRLEQPVSGRGLITTQGILLPVQDHLELYDLRTLVKLKEIPVQMPGKMPVGSLVSDGSRLWIAAMNRLIAVEPVSAIGTAAPIEEGN
jgi:Tfp pilus assembly protein PilF